MSSGSQSSHRSRCYRESPNEHAEVTVPEPGTMSITVTLAPRVRDGLYALLRAQLTSMSAQSPTEREATVTNFVIGDVSGNAIQAGNIHGGINLGSTPRRKR